MDDNQARHDAVRDALHSVLEEGESFQVLCEDGDVWVNEIDASPCAIRHPRLYGRLLAVNEQLHKGAGYLSHVLFLLAGTFCVGLRLHLWDGWLSKSLAEKLNSYWFFALTFFIVFSSLHFISNRLQWMRYVRHRPTIFRFLRETEVDVDTLLSWLEGDGRVARVTHFLKIDPLALPVEETS